MEYKYKLFLTLLIAIVSCKAQNNVSNSKTIVEAKNGEITSIKGVRKISGLYPHFTTYTHARLDGTYSFGNECGIGGLAVWNDKLYMINYAAHQPKGSEHKLYIIDKDNTMRIFEKSKIN